ncbi:hypothetical protein MUK42_37700 [Musa troglodytarum]|uniref:Uncharacterized protein n=1 Tax=Musa troglodytarum TaxID=320322 RepID=A0A9E7JKB7_9LILI|nr:hypothetical protein MUK42_37700 [Musa troglodytarum]
MRPDGKGQYTSKEAAKEVFFSSGENSAFEVLECAFIKPSEQGSFLLPRKDTAASGSASDSLQIFKDSERCHIWFCTDLSTRGEFRLTAPTYHKPPTPVHKANSQPFGLFVQSPNDCDAALSIAVSVAITAVVLRAVLSRIKLSISSINCLGKGVKVGIDGNCDIVIVSATSSLLPPLQPPLFYYSRSMTHLSKIPRIPLRKLRTVVSALYHSRTTSAIASPPLCLIGPIVTFMALAGLA